MRILAFVLGISIAAIFVTVFAAAEPEPSQDTANEPAPAQVATPRTEAGSLHLAAALAGLTALIVLAPAAGRF